MNAHRHSRPVILCIDDEEMALELKVRKRVLESAGYTVLTTTNPQKALEIFRENHVDLVLTEQLAPTPHGSFTLAAMKMLKNDVPIAIYSAHWEESPEYMRFADVFVTKLVSVEELLSTIERLLRGSETARAA